MNNVVSRQGAWRLLGVAALVVVLAGCTTYTYSVNATPDPSDSTYFSVENNATLRLTNKDLLTNDAVKVIETKNGSSETSYYTPTFMRLKGGVDHQTDFGPFTIASSEGGQVRQAGWGQLLTYFPPGGSYVGGDSFQYDACRTLPSVSNGHILDNQDYVVECGTATVHIAVVSPRPTTTAPRSETSSPGLPVDFCARTPCYAPNSSTTTSTTAASTTTSTTAAPTTTTTAALPTSLSEIFAETPPLSGNFGFQPVLVGTHCAVGCQFTITNSDAGAHTIDFYLGAVLTDSITLTAGPGVDTTATPALPAGTYTVKEGTSLLDTITIG